MGANRAMYTGVDNIMSAFETISKGNPYFSLWFSQKNMAIAFDEDDFDAAKSLLFDMLKAAEKSGNDDLLVIKFHTAQQAKAGITDRSPIVGSMYVRVVPVGGSAPAAAGSIGGFSVAGDGMMTKEQWATLSMLENLPASVGSLIDQRFAALASTQPAPVESLFEKIIGMLPDEAISAITNRVLDFALPQQNKPAAPAPMRVSGIEDKPAASVAETYNDVDVAILDDAIDRLAKHCRIDTDLKLLADLADNDLPKFQMMLQLLRAQ